MLFQAVEAINGLKEVANAAAGSSEVKSLVSEGVANTVKSGLSNASHTVDKLGSSQFASLIVDAKGTEAQVPVIHNPGELKPSADGIDPTHGGQRVGATEVPKPPKTGELGSNVGSWRGSAEDKSSNRAQNTVDSQPNTSQQADTEVFTDTSAQRQQELKSRDWNTLSLSEKQELKRLNQLEKKSQTMEADARKLWERANDPSKPPLSEAEMALVKPYEQRFAAADEAKRQASAEAEKSREEAVKARTLIPREHIASEKIHKLDEAKKNWAPNTVGADTLSRPQKALENARKGGSLEGDEQQAYNDYVSGIEQKIEGGRTLTPQEENDIRDHYDREIITGRQEMGQELTDIGAKVNEEMATNNGELSEETKGRMGDWLNNLFGGKPDEAQKMLIEAVRKGPSDRLKNLFATATPEKAKQVKEMIADLAILEIRYRNSHKITNELKHQAWDVRDAIADLGDPPSPDDQSVEAYEKRNRFYALEMLLMQKKGEIVQQRFLGQRLINEYNKTVNEIKRVSGQKHWLMYQAAKVGGKLGDMAIDIQIAGADIKDVEGKMRPQALREGKALDLSKVGKDGKNQYSKIDDFDALM